jgi:hypothetical protein
LPAGDRERLVLKEGGVEWPWLAVVSERQRGRGVKRTGSADTGPVWRRTKEKGETGRGRKRWLVDDQVSTSSVASLSDHGFSVASDRRPRLELLGRPHF